MHVLEHSLDDTEESVTLVDGVTQVGVKLIGNKLLLVLDESLKDFKFSFKTTKLFQMLLDFRVKMGVKIS